MFKIDAEDPRPLYVQIVDAVRWAILRGSLLPDDPLPSVRELSKELRINPNTVQQAYRELEREGLVHVRRGQGTFVNAEVDRTPLREEVAGELGARCLRDATRAGLSMEELIEGIRAAAAAGAGLESTVTPPQNQQPGRER